MAPGLADGPWVRGFCRGSSAPSTSWWDERLTRLLLESVPPQARLLVELDCGAARAAHVLLPFLPDARYLGVDFDPARLAEARASLDGLALAERIELRLAPPAAVPLPDRAACAVLSVTALQHRTDLPAVLAEAARLLGGGGRLVTLEPDNLGQRFYFDGVLEEINAVFHQLCLRARVARQPADIALGPRLPSLLCSAGFHSVCLKAHIVESSRHETASTFFSRLERLAVAIAQGAGLGADHELVLACEQAIKRCLFADMPKRLGFSCHLVPVFLCTGEKL